jgi:hypothetical protein
VVHYQFSQFAKPGANNPGGFLSASRDARIHLIDIFGGDFDHARQSGEVL